MRQRYCNECHKWTEVDSSYWQCKFCGHDNQRSSGFNMHVMPDIQPYKSMIDGTIINSRSQHRAHLKQHGCVEVGNDSSLKRTPVPLAPPPGLKETLTKAVFDKYRRK